MKIVVIGGTGLIGNQLVTRLREAGHAVISERDDPRPVAVDPAAPYFGVEIDDASLTPGPGARIMPTRFDDWLAIHLPTSVAA